MDIGRIIAIASNVFREVIRDRVLYLIGFFAIFLVGSLRLLSEFAIVGTENKIIVDLGLAAIGAMGLIVAVFIGTGMIQKEIEKRTILLVLAKPVARAELIAGKHLGLSAVLAVLVAATTAIYLGFLSLNQIDYPLGSILVAVFYIFLELSLLAAFAITFSVFTSSLLATLLAFGVYLMGHLSPDIVKAGQLSENPAIESFTKNLYLVLPDLSRLDLKNMAVYGSLPDLASLLGNAVYALLYTAFLLAIANLIFWRREF